METRLRQIEKKEADIMQNKVSVSDDDFVRLVCEGYRCGTVQEASRGGGPAWKITDIESMWPVTDGGST